jgi:hypothetical protein
MQSVADRRTFVRHMMIGLPVIAGTTSIPRVLGAVGAREAGALAPTMDSALRDIARLHNQLRRRGALAGDFRAAAAHLRTLAGYQLQGGHDGDLTRAVRELVDQRGHEILASHVPDVGDVRRQLVTFGFDLPTAAAPIVTVGDRTVALERITRGGLAQTYLDTAAVLEGVELEFMLAAAGGACEILAQMKTALETVAAIMCSIATFVPPIAPDCFAATSVLALVQLLIFLMQC